MNKFKILIIISHFINYAQESLDNKIAQLLIIPSAENPNAKMLSVLRTVIEKNKPGGILFFLTQNNIEAQIETTKYYQSISQTPLIMCQDLMRANYPKMYVLGFVKDKALIYELATQMAKECKSRGINWNFSPNSDTNFNKNNPIIGHRAFSNNPKIVAEIISIFIKAYDDAGVASTAKHFPGHGDIDLDSHFELPEISKSLKQLEEEDLIPFEEAIKSGVPAIMPGHLLTALDTELPATLSPKAITYLRDNMKFNGIIIADALCMKAITNSTPQEKAAALALKAGNDMVILMSSKEGSLLDKLEDEDFYLHVIPAAIEEIKNLLSPQEIEEKYQRVKKFKEKYVINADELIYSKDDYNGEYQKNLIGRIYKNSLIIQANLDEFKNEKIIITQENYRSITEEQIASANKIIIKISATQTSFNLMNYKFDVEYKNFVQELLNKYNEKILLILFANHYAAQEFEAKNKIIAFEENEFTRKVVDELI